MIQSRQRSLKESLTNTFVGTGLNLGLTQLYFWALGIPFPILHNVVLTVLLTFVSIARGYYIRRSFAKTDHASLRLPARKLSSPRKGRARHGRADR